MNGLTRNILSEVAKAYPIPIALALLAWVPNETFHGILFNPHGGVGWLLLLLAFPWLIARIIILVVRGPSERRPQRKRLGLILFVAYLPLSIVCAYSLRSALGAPQPPLVEALRWLYI